MWRTNAGRFIDLDRSPRRLLLFVLSLVLFLSALGLGLWQQLLHERMQSDLRSNGWGAYQAAIELAYFDAAITKARLGGGDDSFRELYVQAQILLGRARMMRTSEETELLRAEAGFEALVGTMEDMARRARAAAEAHFGAAVAAGLDELANSADIKLLSNSIIRTSLWNAEQAASTRNRVVLDAQIAVIVLCLASFTSLIVLFTKERRMLSSALDDVSKARGFLEREKENSRLAIDANPSAIFVVDGADGILMQNKAGMALSGRLDAGPLSDLLSPCHGDGDSDGVRTVHLRSAGGEVTGYRVSIRRLTWGDRPAVMVICEDLKAQAHVAFGAAALARSASIGEMASSAAHELNQPLSVISLAASNGRNMLEAGASQEEIDSKFEKILKQIDRARRITEQIRRFARSPTDIGQRFAIQHAVLEAMSFVGGTYHASGTTLRIEGSFTEQDEVSGPETLFQQVLVNILTNAHDAIVTRRKAGGGAGIVQVREIATPEVLAVEIVDDGGGIADSVLGNLFEPFVTTKSADHGTGLGLSFAKSVVSAMGGRITAENTGEGARFRIFVPRAQAAAPEEQADGAEEGEAWRRVS